MNRDEFVSELLRIIQVPINLSDYDIASAVIYAKVATYSWNNIKRMHITTEVTSKYCLKFGLRNDDSTKLLVEKVLLDASKYYTDFGERPTKKYELDVEFTEEIPENNKLNEGILYVSNEYDTCIHLCACGCGLTTVTPTHEGNWKLELNPTEDGDLVTLKPSILNKSCGAHYFITKNKVDWCK